MYLINMPALEGVEFYLSKKIGRAISDYQMLGNGERIAVGVSGGKDSLTLLRLLKSRLSFLPIKYDLIVLHLGDSSQAKKTRDGLLKLGYECPGGLNLPVEPGRFWDIPENRETLLKAAGKSGCRKLALGHHFDDMVGSLLGDMLFKGGLSPLMPKCLYKGITVISPMAYVHQDMIRKAWRTCKEKSILSGREDRPSDRDKAVKALIRLLEKSCPEIKTNIFRSINRIKRDYLP